MVSGYCRPEPSKLTPSRDCMGDERQLSVQHLENTDIKCHWSHDWEGRPVG